jgi:hypothetical protein
MKLFGAAKVRAWFLLARTEVSRYLQLFLLEDFPKTAISPTNETKMGLPKRYFLLPTGH